MIIIKIMILYSTTAKTMVMIQEVSTLKVVITQK